MRKSLTLAALALGTAPATLVQESWAQEWGYDARLTVAAANITDESSLAYAGDDFLGTGSLVVTHTSTSDSGLTWLWRGEARVERDARTRPSFAGVLGDCPASNVTCPRVPTGAIYYSPISPATGISSDGAIAEEDVFVSLEGLSLDLSGSWGEAILGFDTGVASRLDARAPTVLQRVSAFSPGLDPTGLVTTRARNDVSGASAKVSYLSPRWVGLRLGVSFAPNADLRGADFDPDFDAEGQAKADLEGITEAAASYAHQFSYFGGFGIRTAITYTTASSESDYLGFDRYEAVGAGLEVEKGDWTGGLRWLSSNNAWESGDGDYEAWEIGVLRHIGDVRLGVEYGSSQDQLSGLEGQSWLVGGGWKFNENLDFGVALTSSEADVPILLLGGSGHTNASNTGIVFELTVRN